MWTISKVRVYMWTQRDMIKVYQDMICINGSDVWLQPASEKLSQISVEFKVFYGCFLQVTTEHPDVQAQKRFTQEHWKL